MARRMAFVGSVFADAEQHADGEVIGALRDQHQALTFARAERSAHIERIDAIGANGERTRRRQCIRRVNGNGEAVTEAQEERRL